MRKGDTLDRIAAALNTGVAHLVTVNGILHPDRIAVGRNLVYYHPASQG